MAWKAKLFTYLNSTDGSQEARFSEGFFTSCKGNTPSVRYHPDLSAKHLFELVRQDVNRDVRGVEPLSSLSYICTMARMMFQFHQFEMELRKIRNPLYVRAFETDPAFKDHKRFGLVLLALKLEDEERLRVMAREFQNPRTSCREILYWDFEGETPSQHDERFRKEQESPCTTM
ncbi:hypothetical protein CONLIGDRAFT_640080 [Coniochaeta ligniaria NRRL 30616]|uniref:Uncharacterized protein n=1 Tax=Coniochaeta ligniaria NRRL 30616 TaxID=1408157 RepID=A0A1J7JSE3_9PEZI|nr:hypothetical protein CONLIGDRAFT_640080 [Coniochaeta ligniaria NRRL 30616]